MAIITDPRYRELAQRAAEGLHAGPDVTRAILAQFACEKGTDAWPPQDNNPGNIHTGPLAEVGIHLPGGIGDSGAVAAFPNPLAGADGYAAYIGHHPLYVAARIDIGRDQGQQFLHDVMAQGYGTDLACCLTEYRLAAPFPSPLGGGSPLFLSSPDVVTIRAGANLYDLDLRTIYSEKIPRTTFRQIGDSDNWILLVDGGKIAAAKVDDIVIRE